MDSPSTVRNCGWIDVCNETVMGSFLLIALLSDACPLFRCVTSD
ncbi:hypothetical protein [Coleofasciculus sp. FACHB-SPT9]|nr:hypothetical protein [Coleofasciculus sp. FACHB-SPT9]